MGRSKKPCQCGCGNTTWNMFAQGHDARLLSQLHQQLESADKAVRTGAMIELGQRKWLFRHPANWSIVGRTLAHYDGDPRKFVESRTAARIEGRVQLPPDDPDGSMGTIPIDYPPAQKEDR